MDNQVAPYTSIEKFLPDNSNNTFGVKRFPNHGHFIFLSFSRRTLYQSCSKLSYRCLLQIHGEPASMCHSRVSKASWSIPSNEYHKQLIMSPSSYPPFWPCTGSLMGHTRFDNKCKLHTNHNYNNDVPSRCMDIEWPITEVCSSTQVLVAFLYTKHHQRTFMQQHYKDAFPSRTGNGTLMSLRRPQRH